MANQSFEAVLAGLESQGRYLAIAESLTGGAVSAAVVDVPGASKVFLGSVVAYQTQLKNELLGVSKALLSAVGPVDAQVAIQMARGVRSSLASKMALPESAVIGLATTGVAGPDAQDGIPAGTAFIGLSFAEGEFVYPLSLSGSRAEIRADVLQATIEVLGEHFL
ncbi:MAG: CinA family protein [Rhodoluna sp.]